MISLPENLAHAVHAILKTMPTTQWVSEARKLSRRYRGSRDAFSRSFAASQEQIVAYLAQIMPSTYAQLYGAMAAMRAHVPPDWQPCRMLDIGSGPGTAIWAALEHWPSLTWINAWEREPAFIEIGRRLAETGEHPAMPQIIWNEIDVSRRRIHTIEEFDLVVIGHVLNELSPGVQQKVLSWAWQRCKGAILIVEPGTSAAFRAVKSAREQLQAFGAHTLAPCPHEQACPLVDDFCHFPQRLQRPPFQRRAKAALSQWEDCKFSYAAMSRFAPLHVPKARIIRAPQVTKAYAEVRLCTPNGLVQHRDNKSDRIAFKRTQELPWGGTF
jgi:ribosomal protein RSM22 (predicted rRNA methylase)